jgi:mannose-6-phosphate isomerase-like protein (cupin superfamily)
MQMFRSLFALLLIAPVTAVAQTPAAPTAKPAAPRPAARPASLIIQVTDALGSPLANTDVTAQGPVSREGTTGDDGALRLLNMRAGTYRLRFEREGSITLERELTLRVGESLTVDVALNPAPAITKPEEPARPATPEPATKSLPPPGEPKVTPVPLFLEKNFVGREPRRDSSLGCTSTATATLHQLREAWINHTHDDADEWIYVVAGEGILRLGSSEQRVLAGTFSLVPHTVSHALLPQGRNPLIIISVLSGPPCKG